MPVLDSTPFHDMPLFFAHAIRLGSPRWVRSTVTQTVEDPSLFSDVAKRQSYVANINSLRDLSCRAKSNYQHQGTLLPATTQLFATVRLLSKEA